MGANLYWVFVAVAAIGCMLILLGGKHNTLDVLPTASADTNGPAKPRDWPQSIQWGYLAVLVGIFGWLSNYMSFPAVMLIFVVITGSVGFVNTFFLAKRRPADKRPNHFIDYCQGFFPVILIVFLLRSFVAEPFQIPSSSMRPGLIVGDFILVNKFVYGLRVPVLNSVFLPISRVERGDVAVFNYPPDPQINYIKRVIGLPGDTVEYRNKRLTVNQQPVFDIPDGSYEYLEQGLMMISADKYNERMGNKWYYVLNNSAIPPVLLNQVMDFPYRDRCRYNGNGFSCKVPAGHYFMMGDNRDNSGDSRYWGFVDDRLLVGKAFMVWMNFGHFARIGKMIH